ncbi:MAG TPA: hypothetical protein VFD58_18625 [Blastocatellia bacterium]|nr:hypothetical protein [Blastocatellia bacterium]
MPGRSKRQALVVSLWLLVMTGVTLVPRATGGQQALPKSAAAEAAEQARSVLRLRCFQCHGQNGMAAKNVFVLDRARLVASQTVTPGDAGSLLLKVVESGVMPLGGPELAADEKAALRNWILGGAPDWDSGSTTTKPRAFLSEASLLKMIRDDLELAPTRERPFLRYLSLAHLYNAGVADDELDNYRAGLARLVNSLSWHREITQPAPVDPLRTLFRIDLRDYQWTAEQWQKVIAAYPYGLIAPEAERITRLSGEIVPYVRADWFTAQASVPPLYHEILGLPFTASELERRLGVDAERNLTEEKNVIRAGVRSSGVSQNNRVLERHVSPFGAYWRSYDFRGSSGDQNIFADPLRLNPAGGEIIFNLPNGLQAYFLADARGRRIDAAPVEIVSDRNQPDDPVIRNGRSCLSCHYAGMKSFNDDVRPTLLKVNAASFDHERALALYVSQARLNRKLAEDEERFRRAEAQMGGRPASNANTEPVNALSRRFNAELSVAQAAAEVGLEPRDFQDRIRWNRRLDALGLGQLLTANSGLRRDVWERHFGEVVRELQLGVVVSGRAAAARGTWAGANADRLALTAANRRAAPPAQARPLSNPNAANNDLADLLNGARSALIRSETVYLRQELLEAALQKLPQFQSLGIAIVKDPQAADLVIDLNRPLFTFDFTYSVTHRATSRLLLSGKVVAFDGNTAAPKIAGELVKRVQAARPQGAGSGLR